MYNYFEAVKKDVTENLKYYDNVIRDNYDNGEFDRDKICESLYDDMWVDDGITGNASGSYYCNSYKAEEAICHNLDLLAEACDEFGGDMDILKNGAEACDVTIRCYLLSGIIYEVIEDMSDEELAEVAGIEIEADNVA